MVVDIPTGEGESAGSVYLVNYSEDLWLAFNDEQRQFCKDTWIRKATPISGVRFVTLRLYPDDLFPMHGNEKPYVAWQHEIDRVSDCGYRIEAVIVIRLTDSPAHIDPVRRANITRALEGFGRGAAWQIVASDGSALDQGKL